MQIRPVAGSSKARESASISVTATIAPPSIPSALSLAQGSAASNFHGAFTRRYLEAHMPRLFARCRSARKPLAVLVIDIDHFKRINDAHGHAAGDHVLKEIVNRATIASRPSGLAARMGGEEFAVVIPEKDLDAELQIAERLRGRIGDTLVEGADCAPPYTVTVSIGVAVAQPDREEEPGGAFRRADTALYKAKRAGGNRVMAELEIG